MSFAGLLKTKPARFHDALGTPKKPHDGMFIDGLCRFAGLFPVGAAQNTWKFHSAEQNNDFVDKSRVYPHYEQERNHTQAQATHNNCCSSFVNHPPGSGDARPGAR